MLFQLQYMQPQTPSVQSAATIIYKSPLIISPWTINGHHFANDIFKCIFVNEKFCVLVKISLTFVPKGPIDNPPALV